MNEYLLPGGFVDSAHPKVMAFAAQHAKGANGCDKAVALYYAVRDSIRYNPFQNFLAEDTYRASACLEQNLGWCVSKAALLAAAARAAGIAARVGFADVKNHLTTPELTEKMGTDLFVYHGYTDLYLEGKWVKATPAFNLSPQTLKGTSVRLNLVVADPDALTARALAAGATVVFPIADQPYGMRQGRVADPYGHHWLIGKPL